MMTLTRQKVWFAIFVLVVFLAGAAVGALAARHVLFRVGLFGLQPPGPPSPGRIVVRMSRELDLTAEQRDQLEAIFERRGEELEKFRLEAAERFEVLRRQIDADIAAILTPEQRAKFEEMPKRRVFERRRERGGRGGFPGPPPPPPR